MPGDNSPLRAERVQERDHIAGQVQHRVLGDVGRRAGLAVAALVRRYRVVASGGEGGQLVTPRVPALRESVQQEHERAVAGLGDVHGQSAGLQLPVRDRGNALRHGPERNSAPELSYVPLIKLMTNCGDRLKCV